MNAGRLRVVLCERGLRTALQGRSLVTWAAQSSKLKLGSQHPFFSGVRCFHATKPVGKRDYYDILGVPRTATEAELKKAYYKLAKQFHPDQNAGDKDSASKFSEINEAYEVLKNPEKRQLYDQFGPEGVEAQFGGRGGGAQGFADAESIFREFSDFFQGFGGATSRRARRGADIQTTLDLSFEEAVFGATKEMRVDRSIKCETCSGQGGQPGTKRVCSRCNGSGQESITTGFFVMQSPCRSCEGTGHKHSPCRSCNGEGFTRQARSLQVKVPAGVDNDTSIRLAGQGDPGLDGHNGHLFVRIQVSEHPMFERQGPDVHITVTVPLSDAILGTTVSVPTITGHESVKVPPGSQHGDIIVLHGKGIKKISRGGHGDEYIHIHVALPKHLTEKQRQILKEYAQHEDHSVKFDKPPKKHSQ